jgi:hypothetical protein
MLSWSDSHQDVWVLWWEETKAKWEALRQVPDWLEKRYCYEEWRKRGMSQKQCEAEWNARMENRLNF